MLHALCRNCFKRQLFTYNSFKHLTGKDYSKQDVLYNTEKHDSAPEQEKLVSTIQKYKNKLLYSGYIESHRLKLGYKRNVATLQKRSRLEEREKSKKQSADPLPLSLKYLYATDNDDDNINKTNESSIELLEQNISTHFPFEVKDSNTINYDIQSEKVLVENQEYQNLADLEIKERLKYLNASNWMTDYENYEETEVEQENNWEINYGTPDPNSNISNVPCGGCGAQLHCKDTVIPGYIPSEIYKNHSKKGGMTLQGIICQRCYFLKNYNLALQIQLSPEEYPKVLKTIRTRDKALVILIVDLLDFPCSIWPGAADLLGSGRPIFLVGNKVDLLPQDGKGFLDRVAKHLKNSARESGFATTDIKHVALISATTGFGVEDLITKLHSFWEYQGDVFLVGCTNVGKSSLFNALLQSDYCKSQAVDLIQRATVSPWPGTTLNLLKFPILRMSGHRSYLRSHRLQQISKRNSEENKLRKSQLVATKNPKYATLIGHIGRTFLGKEPVAGEGDIFSVKGHSNAVGRVSIGINENDRVYAMGKWCYDTPGVVQPEQLLNLLTTEELLLTIPKKLLRPHTFCLQPGSSIFIAGLVRLDYLQGNTFARFTVFCSSSLPITICKSDIADELYKEFLGSKFFAVPSGGPERLQFWPGLKKNKEFTIKGIDWSYCCADVVLSSSGWISVAGSSQAEYQIKASVPENCGIYLRDALLPGAVSLRGKRVRDSPAYRSNKYYVKI